MKSYRYTDELRRHIEANLSGFDAISHEGEGLRRAAVAITIVACQRDPKVYNIQFGSGWEDHAAVILTRRSTKLRKHAGQWALPGGRLDEGETVEEAALRELSEEVGLSLSPERIVGRLDDFTTRSGFVMTPIVVWGGAHVHLTPNPEEVSAIYRIPLAEFMRTDAPVLERAREGEHPILLMPVGTNWIAAPTAALLYQFREVAILGNQIRVAHYEQPTFAWR